MALRYKNDSKLTQSGKIKKNRKSEQKGRN